MVLNAIIHLDPDRMTDVIELQDITLMFFDTVLAEMKALLHLDPHSDYDYFEFMDENEPSAVRTEEELQSLVDDPPDEPVHIWLRSSRMDLPSDSAPLTKEVSLNIEQIGQIAEGQFGIVFKGYDHDNQRNLAVKSITILPSDQELISQEVEILRFCRECPYIVYFYHAIMQENLLQIFLEYMDGLSLDRYGRLPSAVLGAASVCIVEGLNFLWKNKIMHRDIKPSNFLINTDGKVKIADFGTSRVTKFSVVRSTVGTQAYLSPERIRGSEYTFAGDVWSLGLSLMEMALGQAVLFPPFNGIMLDVSGHVLKNWNNFMPLLNTVDPALLKFTSACLKGDPLLRISYKEVITMPYVVNNKPVNHEIVAQFVKQNVAQATAFFSG